MTHTDNTTAVKANFDYYDPGKVVWTRFKRNKIAVVGLIMLSLLVFSAVFAPLVTPYGPDEGSLVYRSNPPSSNHWLGTDTQGRDVYTRIIYGGRVSLTVGLGAVLIQVIIGTILGAIAGYAGGLVDGIVMRTTDTFLCFPFLSLVLVISAIMGPNIWYTMLVIGLLGWTGTCRIVRGQLLQIRNTEYIEATRALGLSRFKIIFKHMLPNAMAPLLVNATLALATAILLENALTFLGMGISHTQVSWGNMLHIALNLGIVISYPWMWIPPGMMILFSILSINLVGDGLRDALDPRLKL